MKEVKVVIDASDERFEYGRRIFEDGPIIPFCRLLPTALIGQRWEWRDSEWKIVDKHLKLR